MSEALSAPPRPDRSKFRIEDLPDIFDVELTQNWLVEDLIPENSLVLFTGESGSGKSSVVLVLADAVAAGKEFLGRECQQRPVLIVDRENGLPIYAERFKRFSIERNPAMKFWGNWNDFQPGGPTDIAIKKFCLERRPLIIFDSFVAFNEGDEQNADETREYMDAFRILTSLGATVLVIHHTGKSLNSKQYRGSSDIKASVDVGLVLEAKRPLLKQLLLKSFKSREGVLDAIQITYEDNRLVELEKDFIPKDTADWKAVETVVKTNPGLNQGQIIKMLPGVKPFRVRKVLLAGCQTGDFLVRKGLKHESLYHLGTPREAQVG